MSPKLKFNEVIYNISRGIEFIWHLKVIYFVIFISIIPTILIWELFISKVFVQEVLYDVSPALTSPEYCVQIERDTGIDDTSETLSYISDLSLKNLCSFPVRIESVDAHVAGIRILQVSGAMEILPYSLEEVQYATSSTSGHRIRIEYR